MMKWFYKWLGTKIVTTVQDEMESIPVATIASSKSNRIRKADRDHFDSEPITFKMFKASGGWAIEFRHYDSKNDRIDTSLYVVNGEEELGKHISQIITMEALKR